MLFRNPKTGDYVVVSDDEERAREVGLTLAERVRGRGGERVWFTRSPYAALPYYDEGNEEVRGRLRRMREDYEQSRATDSAVDHYPSPVGREYMPFQRAGISYALARPHCLIGDEPGLGKTVQAVGVANVTSARRVLVVCPASIRLNWRREIRAWSVLPDVRTQVVLSGSDGVDPEASYVVISYHLMTTMAEQLAAEDWDLVVLDEAHYLKSPSAQRTRAMFGSREGPGIAERAGRVLALTGTPLPNRPRECYTLARALCWESVDWMSYDAFCSRFNPTRTYASGYKDEKVGRLPELQARLRCNFMVRRLKEDVLEDLPDKRYEFTYVEPDGKIREVLHRESMLEFSVEDLKDPFGDTFGEISTVRREMGEAMAPRVAEHVAFLLETVGVPKVALFAHHRSVMDFLRNQLLEYGVAEVRGGMTAGAKQDSIDAFTHREKRVFLGQLDAAGFGIDGLQHATSHVVIAEPAWTPGTNEQVIDRCHRIGQHDNVLAQFMLVEGSFNEKVLALVLDKTQNIHGALDA